jgi:hypothetical protein
MMFVTHTIVSSNSERRLFISLYDDLNHGCTTSCMRAAYGSQLNSVLPARIYFQTTKYMFKLSKPLKQAMNCVRKSFN